MLRFKIKFYLGSSSDFFCENALLSGTCTYLICKIFKPGLTLKFRKKTGRDEKNKLETIRKFVFFWKWLLISQSLILCCCVLSVKVYEDVVKYKPQWCPLFSLLLINRFNGFLFTKDFPIQVFCPPRPPSQRMLGFNVGFNKGASFSLYLNFGCNSYLVILKICL